MMDLTPALRQFDAAIAIQAGRKIKAPRTLKNTEWPPKYESVLAWREKELALYRADPERLRLAFRYYKRPENCVHFINHWCDTWDQRNVGSSRQVQIPFILFKKQDDLVKFVLACFNGNAPGLIEKSRDMGATWVCVAISVWLWIFWPKTVIGWGSAKAAKVDKLGDPSTIFEKIRLLINGLPDIWKPKNLKPDKHMLSGRILNPQNQASIIGESGQNIGRGGRTRIYFIDESAHLVQPEEVEASLSETTRVRIDLSSVSGPGTVFHRTRKAGQLWNPDKPVVRDKANVLIMDSHDHPEKTPEWHKERQHHFKSRGMDYIYEREIARNYAGSMEGVVIPPAWVAAAIDSHLKLGFDDSGEWCAGLDVADGGLDSNALAARKGVILKHVEEWSERDTGNTARRAVGWIKDNAIPCELQYDCIGVGAGIKAETNRLQDEGDLPRGLIITPWSAGDKVLNPFEFMIPGDKDTPRNRDYYENLKAQAWWELRLRFYRTWQAITEGIEYDPSELISLCSKSLGAMLLQVQEELSQAISKKSKRLKLMVDKSPDGTKSPNCADAIVMSFWPLPVMHGLVSSFTGPRSVGEE